MQLNEFFDTLSTLCIKVLPLLGVILLVYLIMAVRYLIPCLKNANKTLEEANLQLRKLDVPLNTIQEISKSIDSVHELTKESVKTISLAIYENLNALKEWFKNMFSKKQAESAVVPETEEVSVEDIPNQDEGENNGKE